MIDLHDLLSRLGEYKEMEPDSKGNQRFRICCPHPLHDDSRPSAIMIIKDGDMPGFHCYSRNCDNGEILDHLGLRDGTVATKYKPKRKVKPRQKPKKKKKRKVLRGPVHERTHVYRLPECTHEGQQFAEGDVAFVVEKHRTYYEDGSNSKEMPSYFTDAEGKREYRIKDRPRPIYRTLELLEAKPEEAWATEGESNVEDAVEAYGIEAFCINGGSSQRISEIGIQTLLDAGVRVVHVVMDNDVAGEKYCNQFESDLHDHEIVTYRYRAAIDEPGADLSDHINAGYTLEQLIPVQQEYPHDCGEETELSRYVVERCNGELLYNGDTKEWLIYQRGIFVSGQHVVEKRVMDMLVSRRDMAMYDRPGARKLARLRKACEDIKMVKVLKGARTPMNCDSDAMGHLVSHHLLPVTNCVIDLNDGSQHPHSPLYKFGKMAPVKFDRSAECPQFLAFLEMVQPDEGIRDFLQRISGALLTGTVVDGIFQNWGMGANGKSTLIKIWTKILGTNPNTGFASYSDVSTWLEHKNSRSGADHRADLVRLRGSRLVVVSEPKANGILDCGNMKLWTGGEEQVARGAFHTNALNFQPQGTLIFQTNIPLSINDTTDGTWRRMHLIPWRVQIPSDQQVKDYDQDLIRDESSGILNWMIEGAMQFLREGLGPIPAPVRKATLQYRHSEDEFGIFLKECTEKDPGGSVTEVGVLYEKYQEWCKSMEIVKVLTKIQFGKTMINRGYEKKRVHTGHVWCDLHLIRDGEIPEEDSP